MPDEIVVTATRFEQPLRQTLSSTTVITEQDIRNSQAPDVPTILRDVAGVEISQSGGIGKTTSLYLRGTNSTQVLVLIDGVRVNSATTGTTALDQLMLDQIERIEVVRGNVSSLYGSEAIGGVVQIFTKRGRGAPAFNASAGLGSQGTRRISAGVSGARDGNDYSVQASAFNTDGVSALNPGIYPKANPDRDGYRNTSLSANLGHDFNTDHRIRATLFASNGNNQYDSTSGSPTDVNTNRPRLWKYSLSSEDQFTEMWNSKLQLANGVDQDRNYLNGAPSASGSLYQTTSSQVSWQNLLHVGAGTQFLLGAESLHQKVASDINPGYAQNTRQTNSLLAGYTGHYAAHQLQFNLRQDNNSQYGNVATGLLGYGYDFTEAWRATANYSTAYRAPTFNELYYPNYGNAALHPERSRNVEAGVHYAKGTQQFDAVYFSNIVKNLIVDNAQYLPINLDRALINGVELSYAGQFGQTGIKAALTAQDPRDQTTGQLLVRRARLHSSLGVIQEVGAWKLGGEWLYSEHREDNFTDPTTFVASRKILPAYNVFNLTAGYPISKKLRWSLRVDNLTNQNDSNAYGYNPLGRRLYVGINYQP
jgi:vitamin B12 transporter